MAQYSRTVLTDAGVILARRIMDDETLTMEFTRIQTGSGEYSSGEDIASRTSLKAPKQSFPISSRSVTSEQVLHLKYVVSNVNQDSSPLTVGYYVRELAIYAQVSGEAEILYAIAIADADSADYLPEYDELQPTTITMDWFLPVGNAEQINVYASPDAYALAEDLEALEDVVAQKLDADGDSAGNTVTFTSSDVPDSSVTKDTGWTSAGALTSGETHESFMTKISRMLKNIRWLYKLIGTTDISSIGNGTITNALSVLNAKTGNLTPANTNTDGSRIAIVPDPRKWGGIQVGEANSLDYGLFQLCEDGRVSVAVADDDQATYGNEIAAGYAPVIVRAFSIGYTANKDTAATLTLQFTPPERYTPVGVVGYNCGSNRMNLYTCYLASSNRVAVQLHNFAAVTITSTFTAYILFRYDGNSVYSVS